MHFFVFLFVLFLSSLSFHAGYTKTCGGGGLHFYRVIDSSRNPFDSGSGNLRCRCVQRGVGVEVQGTMLKSDRVSHSKNLKFVRSPEKKISEKIRIFLSLKGHRPSQFISRAPSGVSIFFVSP
jgi:hypothetical protein